MAITATVTRGKTWSNGEEANSTTLNAAALPTVTIADADVKAAYEANANTNAYTDAEKTKLAGIETGATADQSAAEILTAIKTVDGAGSGLDADVLDGQQGTYYRSVDNHTDGSTNKLYTAAEKTKLAGIETGATADQSAAEIKTLYESNANTNAFTDAEKTKLAGVQGLIDAVMPVGSVILWSGSVASIPAKWALCDGTSGTPDLRGRFIVGAGGAYAVGATGGAESVTLTTAQIPAHSHGLRVHNSTVADGVNPYALSKTVSSGWGASSVNAEADNTTIVKNAGGGLSHENRPPFYALCYIMRVS
jgi:microcystin-dependent protein